MLHFDYVASGMSHAKIATNAFSNSPDIVEKTNILLREMQGMNDHKYSVLFNGYKEKRVGQIINDTIRKSVYSVHADSGGLQVITLGKVITPELKEEIYETQAILSDVAMSFDEIPLVLTGNRSAFHDIKSRYYDPDLVEPYAKKSSENLKRQLEKFAELKTKTKPLMILQGNDLAGYQRWMDIHLENIPKELHGAIGGISIGAGALGQGLLEDAERHFIYTQLTGPDNIMTHLHILGVGSVKRMIPLLIYDHTNLLNREVYTSYDSTTHTSGVTMGNYYLKDKLIPLSRNVDKNLLAVVDCMNSYSHWYGNKFDIHDVHSILCVPKLWKEKYGLDNRVYDRMSIVLTYLFSSILNFTEELNSCYKSKEVLLSKLTPEVAPFSLLYSVRDNKDFQQWKTLYGRSVPSKSVTIKTESVSLEDFV